MENKPNTPLTNIVGVKIGPSLLGPLTIPNDVAPGSCAEKAYMLALEYRYKYGIYGLAAGIIIQLAGVVLLALGFKTPEPWSIELGILGIKVSAAYPGLALMLLGPVWAWITRFDVSVDIKDGGTTPPPPKAQEDKKS